MEFATPWAFLLLLAIPLLIFLRLRLGKKASLRVSNVDIHKASGVTFKQQLRTLPFILRLIVIALLAFALARPRDGVEKTIDHSEGIAIEMVLDRSGSMADDMEYKGMAANRLEVAKEVFKDFVLGGDGLAGRPNDLVGLIIFARYADTFSPLTLGHQSLPSFLKQVHLAKIQQEDGTAIGDAVALAAANLHIAESNLKKRKLIKDDSYIIKSKIIILLTDGQDNASETSIAQAAKLCKDWGIKIYTIGIGGKSGRMQVAGFTLPFGGGGVDVPRLKYMAEETGGKFYMADSDKGLKEIYENIDKLEKSRVESERYMDYSEKFMPLAIAALLLLILEIFLRTTFLRTLP